ncbi:MAG: TIGR02281 family clan AA aspartic protease [Pseudomonadota bacterium]|nr:TIGR02281 family clan AA aspartic protease [Pseudomonadota bacterium]
MLGFAIAALLAVCLVSTPTGAMAASAEIRADSRGHFLTQVKIGYTNLDVLIDTGASFVALSYEDAEHAGLKPRLLTFDVPIATANGLVEAASVTLDRVEVGNVRVHDVAGVVLPRGSFEGTLLGMSFLARLRSFAVEDGRLILTD